LSPGEAVALAAATLLAAATVTGRRRRLIFAAFAALQAWYVWDNFPFTGNHRYLELIFAGLFATLDPDEEEEGRLLLASLQWLVIVVVVYSGLQKLVHGHYFRGQYLAYSLWRETFRAALAPLLPAGELARLRSYTGAVGDGPYVVSGPLFVVVSNAVWVVEIALGALLAWRRSRPFAWVATLLFIAGTELVARELMFGVEFAFGTLLFARGDVARRAVWPAAALLALLVLVRAGMLPEVAFH